MNLMRKATLWVLAGILFSGILTTYFEQTQQSIIMPLRNLLYFGTLHSINYDEIAPVKYKDSEEGYNPVVIAQLVRMKALKVLEQDKANNQPVLNEAEKNKVLEVAAYFLDHGERRVWQGINYTVWSYQMDRPTYGLKAPWLSSMAQGHAIETMLASYRLTGQSIYLETAKLAANSLYVPIEDGGVTRQVEDGVWFEEYAGVHSTKQPYVLNGNIYTLYGLSYLVKEDSSYAELYRKGIMGLKALLPRFDAGVWSRYDLAGNPANAFYQRVHVEQLEDLYNKTGDLVFLDYSQKFKWQTYLPIGVFYRVVALPNLFLVLIMSLNLLISMFILWLGYRWFVKKGRSRLRRHMAKELAAG
jgi:hypothetical protein